MYLTRSLHRAMRVQPGVVASIKGARQLTWRQTGERMARFTGALPFSAAGKILKNALRDEARDAAPA